MRDQTFREDLYYRLQVIEILVPPLRDRREEIPALAEFFLLKYGRLYRRTPMRPTPSFLDRLTNYSWPGNIRELENMAKRFVVLQDEGLILGDLARMETAAVRRGTHESDRTNPPAGTPPMPSRTIQGAPGLTAALHAADTAPAASELPTEPGGTDDQAGVDLQALARAAAMQVEREAIRAALSRFHWNRRKAADYLNVSYKTLLNKIKASGLSDPNH